jgi:hypothetical protein
MGLTSSFNPLTTINAASRTSTIKFLRSFSVEIWRSRKDSVSGDEVNNIKGGFGRVSITGKVRLEEVGCWELVDFMMTTFQEMGCTMHLLRL